MYWEEWRGRCGAGRRKRWFSVVKGGVGKTEGVREWRGERDVLVGDRFKGGKRTMDKEQKK